MFRAFATCFAISTKRWISLLYEYVAFPTVMTYPSLYLVGFVQKRVQVSNLNRVEVGYELSAPSQLLSIIASEVCCYHVWQKSQRARRKPGGSGWSSASSSQEMTSDLDKGRVCHVA